MILETPLSLEMKIARPLNPGPTWAMSTTLPHHKTSFYA